MSEAAVVLVVLPFFAVGFGITAWLVFRTWRRRKDVTLATKVSVASVAAAAAFGPIGTVLGLVKAFRAVGSESVDPSQKARVLAEGISEAMNCTAFALAIWMASVVAALVLSRTRKYKSS